MVLLPQKVLWYTIVLFDVGIATRPFQTYHIDFKTLTRCTEAGNTCILVIVCAFSGLTFLIPAHDSTALTTAKLLVREIVGRYSTPTSIISDKGQNFVSQLFGYCQNTWHNSCNVGGCFSYKQWQSGKSRKKLSEKLKRFATPEIDDRHIEDILPLIELSLRTTCSKICKLLHLKLYMDFRHNCPLH